MLEFKFRLFYESCLRFFTLIGRGCREEVMEQGDRKVLRAIYVDYFVRTEHESHRKQVAFHVLICDFEIVACLVGLTFQYFSAWIRCYDLDKL